MSISYEIGYQLPNGRWYTKNCENGAEYICKLLKRGINEFSVRVWTRARTIEMHRCKRDGKYVLQVNKTYSYYRTQMGNINEYKINGYHFIWIDGQYLPKSC
jgi:hypothetical protein